MSNYTKDTVNIPDDDGFTPLAVAVLRCEIDNVKKLLSIGANPNGEIFNGDTPLMLAIEDSMVEIARLLIDGDADVNYCNKNGDTPIDFAIYLEEKEIADMLKVSGAVPTGKMTLRESIENEAFGPKKHNQFEE